MVGDGGDTPSFQAVEHARIFNADRHRVAGESFRIGDDQFIGGIAKGISQGLDFGLCRTTTCGGVGFMGEEDGVGRHGVSVQSPASFHVRDEAVDHLAHVLHIKTRAVVCGIGRGRPEEFCDGLHAALLGL